MLRGSFQSGRALGWCLVVAASGGSASALAASDQAAVHQLRCDAANVVVRTEQPADAPLACEGARAALAFLSAQGLDVSGGIEIELVRKLPQAMVDASAAGCFLPSANRVLALGYAQFVEGKDWFGVDVNTDLYRGLVAHEVAHAVAACNFTPPKPSLVAYEYVAYVTMLSTMAPALRQEVLGNFPGTGFDSDLQMNSTIYQFDPMHFGAEAYRHYLKPGNGRAYLHRVLAGEVLRD